jgi:photoactive yellow protein
MTSIDVDAVLTLNDDDLDTFELGVVKLDRNGVIRFFNKAEARFVHRHAHDALGRHYFTDVAPCAAVKDFQGRFIGFIADEQSHVLTFGFFYKFGWGHKQVAITLLKRDAAAQFIYIVTQIEDVADD